MFFVFCFSGFFENQIGLNRDGIRLYGMSDCELLLMGRTHVMKGVF
jgi:hypothetical protein